MAITFNRKQIADGVSLSVVHDAKFKHNRITVNLILPLSEDTVSNYAILPFLMRKGCESCADFTLLNRKLDELYGAALISDVGKIGACQIITLGVKALDDRYTISNEALTYEAVLLLRNLVFSPLIKNGEFPQQDVELERTNLVDTIEAQINDKRSYVISQCNAYMGKNDPSSVRKYGTVEGAGKITAESAAKAYYDMMEFATVEVMFVGSGDSKSTEQIMKEAFSKIKRSKKQLGKPLIVPAAEKVTEKEERLNITQPKLAIGLRAGEAGDVKTQAGRRLMTALYGGTPSSKLFLNVREKLSLCYYCAARYNKLSEIIMVDCGVEKENIEPAKKEILKQLDDIKNGNFEDETVNNTKLMMKNASRAVGDSETALENWYLSHIMEDMIISPQEDMEMLESITREDIIKAAGEVSLDTVYLLASKEDAVNEE